MDLKPEKKKTLGANRQYCKIWKKEDSLQQTSLKSASFLDWLFSVLQAVLFHNICNNGWGDQAPPE